MVSTILRSIHISLSLRFYQIFSSSYIIEKAKNSYLSESSKNESNNNELENHKEEIRRLQALLKEKEKQIASLQKALENSQDLIVNIHQSKPLQLFRKYDSTIGKILPIKIKKNLKISKRITHDEEARIKTELLFLKTDKKDILFFPMIDWNYRYQRSHHIIQKFAEKGHRVFHFTVSLKPQGDLYEILKLDKNIFEVRLKLTRYFDIYKDKFTKTEVEHLTKIIQQLKNEFGIDALCFVMFPTWTPLVLQLKNIFDFAIVADSVDEIQGFSNIRKERSNEEKTLVEKADFVICSSSYLYHKNSALTKNIFLMPNGGEFEHFNKFLSKALDTYKKPIIGYFGAIAEWFDNDLVEFLARSRPNLTFVFIGDTYGSNLKNLRSLHNVFFLGERPYFELPNYLHSFDVCLIPFKINRLTKAAHPIKIYEYFAAGKPVVATSMPELESMKNLCYIAQDENDFLSKLDIAVREDNELLSRERIEFAKMNTWDIRFNSMYGKLKKIPAIHLLR